MEDLSRDCLPDSTPELLSSAQAPDRRPCLRGRGTRDPASGGRPSLLLDPDGCEQEALRAVGVIYRSPLQLASMNLRGGFMPTRGGECPAFQPWLTGGWPVEKPHEMCRILYSLFLIRSGFLCLDHLGS